MPGLYDARMRVFLQFLLFLEYLGVKEPQVATTRSLLYEIRDGGRSSIKVRYEMNSYQSPKLSKA
jgi:hypothetical protein